MASELAALVARSVDGKPLSGDPQVHFEWYPLQVGPVRIWVFADALKVNHIRVAVTAQEAQEVADVLGALLPTPRIEDLTWQQAEVRIEPHPGDVVRKTAAQHSAEIDRDLGGRTGLVVTVGKSWVLTNSLRAGRAANYGWHGTAAPYPSVSIPGIKVWQPVGTEHNAAHRDYSQTLRLVRRACEVDGKDADLGAVLQDPELARHVSHEGPLRLLRQPGVESPGSRAPTEPMLALGMDQPLRERALAWCLAEAARWGDRPVPPERVGEYLSGCERQNQCIGAPLAEQVLKGVKVSFCAAAQGYAEHRTFLSGDARPPWRAGAREIERDALAGRRTQWISAARARAGEVPPPGALAVYWREPQKQGYGHVERVIEATADGYRSVGANEAGGRWFVDSTLVPYTHPKLLGFAVDDAPAAPVSGQPETTPLHALEPAMSDADWRALRLDLDWDALRAERDRYIREQDDDSS